VGVRRDFVMNLLGVGIHGNLQESTSL